MLTAIYVSWRDTEQLIMSLERLAASVTDHPVEVVVVVNDASGSEARLIASAWPGAVVIANPTNRGFGPAANQGAAVAKGDILLFLNPDSTATGDPLSSIVRALDEHPSAIAVTPRLCDSGPS